MVKTKLPTSRRWHSGNDPSRSPGLRVGRGSLAALTASFDGLHRDVVEGVTTGIVTSVNDRLSGEGVLRAFNLKEEFPAQYSRLMSGDTVEVEITQQHLPVFLQSATVKQAAMVSLVSRRVKDYWREEFNGNP